MGSVKWELRRIGRMFQVVGTRVRYGIEDVVVKSFRCRGEAVAYGYEFEQSMRGLLTVEQVDGRGVGS